MAFISTCQKEAIAYTIPLHEISICLIDTIAPIFNIMHGNRYNSSTFYSRQKAVHRIGWDFMFFCETKIF